MGSFPCFPAFGSPSLLPASGVLPQLPRHRVKKENVIILSWGDLVGNQKYPGAAQFDTPENVRIAVHTWKTKGVDKVLFRVDDFRYMLFAEINAPAGSNHATWADATRKRWRTGY